jgi:hypothetical protein
MSLSLEGVSVDEPKASGRRSSPLVTSARPVQSEVNRRHLNGARLAPIIAP